MKIITYREIWEGNYSLDEEFLLLSDFEKAKKKYLNYLKDFNATTTIMAFNKCFGVTK